MNYDNYLLPKDPEGMTVVCDNPDCGDEVWYEDAVLVDPSTDTWVCDTCRDHGYKTPEEIVYDCDLNDDGIDERSIYVAGDLFFGDKFDCPVCGKRGIVWERSTARWGEDPHHECVCHHCNEMFFVYHTN